MGSADTATSPTNPLRIGWVPVASSLQNEFPEFLDCVDASRFRRRFEGFLVALLFRRVPSHVIDFFLGGVVYPVEPCTCRSDLVLLHLGRSDDPSARYVLFGHPYL